MTVGATSSSTTAPSAATVSLTQNYTTFLKMLTTQLKNQDPTSPMDPSQFTQQLVMYSQVEQQISTNAKLDQLVTATGTNLASAALSYIGMQVDAPGQNFTYSGKPVQLSYGLPSDAASATVSVTDSSGKTVWSAKANTSAGTYNLAWNGKDSDGNAVPNGDYTIKLSAVDSTNTRINGTTGVPGIVDGVETDAGIVYLKVNGATVAESDVTNVTSPATN